MFDSTSRRKTCSIQCTQPQCQDRDVPCAVMKTGPRLEETKVRNLCTVEYIGTCNITNITRVSTTTFSEVNSIYGQTVSRFWLYNVQRFVDTDTERARSFCWMNWMKREWKPGRHRAIISHYYCVLWVPLPSLFISSGKTNTRKNIHNYLT